MNFKPHFATRRELLLGSGALFAWAYMPKLAMAEGRDPRLLVIILRGALDGLATVAPVGDPDWVRLRGDKGLRRDGDYAALPLDNMFALNPAMPNFHRMYKAGQAAVVHAVASPYRERSHFDGQDVLESGLVRPGSSESGWLNRAWQSLTPSEHVGSRQAFAVGPITPLVARGPAPVMSWTPSKLPPASNDTMSRLLDLYRHTDPALGRALEERGALAAIAQGDAAGVSPAKIAATPGVPGAAVRAYFAESAGAAAKFMARADGPRVGALAFDGWDTHANEGADHGRLAALLGALDGAFARNRKRNGRRLEGNRRRGGDRIRPHRAHQRHRRYRSRHRDGGAAGGRRDQRRARDRRLAGRRRAHALSGARSQTDH